MIKVPENKIKKYNIQKGGKKGGGGVFPQNAYGLPFQSTAMGWLSWIHQVDMQA